MEWADTARENSQHQSGPRQNSAFLIWITANRRSWTAFVHPSPSVTIDTPLMNLFGGTAPSRDCHSTRLWSPATAFSSRIGSSRRERSMDDLLQYDDSPTRPQTLACSVRNS